ncbi:ABC transporter permease, partial [Klebsiella pneumoniae]
MKALALVSTPAWWVKGRRKVRASPVLQTLLLLFMLLAMFGPLLNLLIWTVAESWYFPHSLPSRWGLKYWYQVFNPYSDVSSTLVNSELETSLYG